MAMTRCHCHDVMVRIHANYCRVLFFFSCCSKRTIGVGTIDVRPINTDRIRVTCGKCHKAILVGAVQNVGGYRTSFGCVNGLDATFGHEVIQM